MRNCLLVTALLLAVALFPAAFAAGEAGAATRETPAQSYDAVARDWRELLRDAERGKMRDPWLNLEKRFLDILARDPAGNTGAKSRYQAARCREELAKRSFLASDWQHALTHYLALHKDFPKHSLADDGLYHAAVILDRQLHMPEEAAETARKVLAGYPKGDMVKNARQLLASLPQNARETAAQPGRAGTAPRQTESGRTGKSPRETPRQTAPAATPEKPGTIMEQLGLTVNTIMIDAGHGGKDPGAMGNGVTEKHITLALARILGARLKAEGFTVLYTRNADVYVPLDQRAVIANNKKADLFISLHVNASKDKDTHGLETYFMDMARSHSAATVAARENAVSVRSISDLQFIITDLMLTSKVQESHDLAAIVHRKTHTRARQAGFTVGDNGVRSAPFYVLMGARMPAVLVEIGYLSNAADVSRIKSRKYLERLADGIALGVTEYKNKLSGFAKR